MTTVAKTPSLPFTDTLRCTSSAPVYPTCLLAMFPGLTSGTRSLMGDPAIPEHLRIKLLELVETKTTLAVLHHLARTLRKPLNLFHTKQPT